MQTSNIKNSNRNSNSINNSNKYQHQHQYHHHRHRHRHRHRHPFTTTILNNKRMFVRLFICLYAACTITCNNIYKNYCYCCCYYCCCCCCYYYWISRHYLFLMPPWEEELLKLLLNFLFPKKKIPSILPVHLSKSWKVNLTQSFLCGFTWSLFSI